MIRVLLAAFFLFVVPMALLNVCEAVYGDVQNWPGWVKPVLVGEFFVAVFAALFIFNRPGRRPRLPGKSIEENIEDLRKGGLLTSEAFRARRTFQAEEFEDEGSHYFIELEDGRTLYLNGQYLYDFEPIDDDPEENRPRTFPCTEFTILRHKDEGYVVDIQCSGQVLEPEVVAPHFTYEPRVGPPYEDGEIRKEPGYEGIKRSLLES